MLELVLLDSTYICKKWICCGILEIFLTYQRRIWSFVVFSKLWVIPPMHHGPMFFPNEYYPQRTYMSYMFDRVSGLIRSVTDKTKTRRKKRQRSITWTSLWEQNSEWRCTFLDQFDWRSLQNEYYTWHAALLRRRENQYDNNIVHNSQYHYSSPLYIRTLQAVRFLQRLPSLRRMPGFINQLLQGCSCS